MNERILQFIDLTGLSAIQFADKVGLNRSIIYHIKNGRSAPSLDVVLKILNVFPQINTDWLLYGKGEMLNQNLELYSEKDLFLEDADEEEGHAMINDGYDDKMVSENKNSEPYISSLLNQEEMVVKPAHRIPVKMIIFYSDDSFEVFSLDKSTLV